MSKTCVFVSAAANIALVKYWGKKPSGNLLELIETYSKKGDVVLDPFAGYGVFVCEAYLHGRNAIGNDLNPASVFIQEQLLNGDVQLDHFESEMKRILADHERVQGHWFEAACPRCGTTCAVVSTLRNKANTPLMNKVKCSCSTIAFDYELSETEAQALLHKEREAKPGPHPESRLIRNSRINAGEKMSTDHVFTPRTLICHSQLLLDIEAIENETTRNLARFAFTSNPANCSRLVPPIKSRGPMALGAWMTGFYVGETYLENNVFHYFKNRVAKVIAGKRDFFESNRLGGVRDKARVKSIEAFDTTSRGYLISNQDTKHLEFPNDSIDYIFTDPPYGDSVPYFEQSALWNTWLGFSVDYENEVVISDSKERNKKSEHFAAEVGACINEIHRVLKEEHYFSITFHSLSGSEWYALTRACLESGFLLEDLQWLTQKTFAPRQLNRKKTVKGDVLLTFKKTAAAKSPTVMNQAETEALIYNEAKTLLDSQKTTTNDIYLSLLKTIFSKRLLFAETNFIEVLSKFFEVDEQGFWGINA